MKRILCFWVLMGIWMMPARGFAEQIGVYIAPKFMYSMTMIDGKVTGSVFAEDGEASLGNQSTNTFGGAVALGYNFDKQFNIPLRTEIEYSVFSEAEAKMKAKSKSLGASGEFKQVADIDTLFVNAYVDLDFVQNAIAVPYVGAGIGVGFIDLNVKEKNNVVDHNVWRDAGSKSHTNFAWHVGGGVGFTCTDNIILDVGYRFVSLGSAETQTRIIEMDTAKGKANLQQHQFSTGVRFSF
jgi:opacity protein-like surface antigen